MSNQNINLRAKMFVNISSLAK